MSSSASRGQIVTDALSLAGRSAELRQTANQWLNYSLTDIGLTFRFPELRKIGSSQTLAQGASTASLPVDLGSGMEKLGMIFGPDNKPLTEVSYEEFANTNGFPTASSNVGRPGIYLVDKEAGNFRFNGIADQNYAFTPTYFKTPPTVDPSTSYDSQKVWVDNDIIAVHALIWWIYVFTEDQREMAQEQRLERMLNRWKRETVRLGGTSRVLPSPARFKNMQYKGFSGFNGP